ncbi:hypothetical protein [Paenibacillus sp. Leaf72]|uniref:hypothetical protein n=1 Tax=Paenibacillus sp. Leaf72 TaxID=1736234 RepID=UPI0006F23A20|nr:hypothetical protein [Paenibacillus sp. Leaf72]KQO01093.1 hypothetical protein ASF12_14665 [Paenibacillus sp. Leaf72]
MEHMDEKIIIMMNALETEDHFTGMEREPLEEHRPDLHQPLVKVGTERVPFIQQSLLNGKLAIYMPKAFKPMTPQAAAIKYPSERRPEIIFTNDSGTINLAINHLDTPLSEDEMEDFKESMKEMLQNMQPIREWYEDGIRNIRGHAIGFCEFLTPAINVNLYNLLFFVSLDDRALLCTFNCTVNEMKDWKPIAKSIMDSLVVTSLNLNLR